MPTITLKYTHEEIKGLIEADATRRGYKVISLTFENTAQDRLFLQQATASSQFSQAQFEGLNNTQVRATVHATRPEEEPNG